MLSHAAAALVHLAMLVIEIAAVFVLARLIASRWPGRLVKALDRVGQPLTDLVGEVTARQARRLSGRRLRPEAVPAVALLGLMVLRLLTGALAAVL